MYPCHQKNYHVDPDFDNQYFIDPFVYLDFELDLNFANGLYLDPDFGLFPKLEPHFEHAFGINHEVNLDFDSTLNNNHSLYHKAEIALDLDNWEYFDIHFDIYVAHDYNLDINFGLKL